jgi:hypothetical protein
MSLQVPTGTPVALSSGMSRAGWSLLLGLLCTSHSTVAGAQQAQAAATRRWYGAPILIGGEIGAAALLAEAIAAMHGGYVPSLLWVPTLGAYLLTGPIVHLANDEPANAAASLGEKDFTLANSLSSARAGVRLRSRCGDGGA